MRRNSLRFASLGVVLSAGCLYPQVITTIAATSITFPSQPLPAMDAPGYFDAGVAPDTRGNVYVADYANNLVERIASDGTLTVVAGNGTPGFSGDGGPATSASLAGPIDVAVDSAGNFFIADFFNQRMALTTVGQSFGSEPSVANYFGSFVPLFGARFRYNRWNVFVNWPAPGRRQFVKGSAL